MLYVEMRCTLLKSPCYKGPLTHRSRQCFSICQWPSLLRVKGAGPSSQRATYLSSFLQHRSHESPIKAAIPRKNKTAVCYDEPRRICASKIVTPPTVNNDITALAERRCSTAAVSRHRPNKTAGPRENETQTPNKTTGRPSEGGRSKNKDEREREA